MSSKNTDKERKPVSEKTLNLLLAAAVLILLIPFARDAFLAYRDRKAEEEMQPHSDRVTVLDYADMLSSAEEEKLKADMLPVTVYFAAAFVTTEDTGHTSAEDYSLRVYNELFDEWGGVLFLIDFDTSDSDGRQLYIRVSDRSEKLTVAKCYTITDNIYTYARDGQYYECARRAFYEINEVLSDRAVPEPMKHMSNLLIAACIALLLVFSVSHRRTRIKRPGEVYLLDNNISKSVMMTNATARLVRRYRRSNSTSSGGGFSGGHSGGGHSSGGWSGGGHSSGGHSGGGGGHSSGGSHGGGHGF